VFSRRLDPIPSWASLLQVFALDAVEAPSRLLPLVVLSATLSSHCHRRPSAFRHRAWLASLEAAYLLEVSGLPALLSCPNSSDEARLSASTGCPASAFSSLQSTSTANQELRRLASKMGLRAQACSPSKVSDPARCPADVAICGAASREVGRFSEC